MPNVLVRFGRVLENIRMNIAEQEYSAFLRRAQNNPPDSVPVGKRFLYSNLSKLKGS